jgi:ubiquinone/menaquinone biosynthesis C-methylase UbiE
MSDAETPGTSAFQVSGEAYDRFMGRYSAPLAIELANAAEVEPGQSALDVGCGPGALTAELVSRLGPSNVAAVDPSEPFVEACRHRHPGVDVRLGRAEELPYRDKQFDAALAQLVLHFVRDPEATAHEMRRVVRPRGIVAACVWDFHEGMKMLRLFWDAATALDQSAPDEARTLRFGRDGEIADLFAGVGLADVRSGALDVEVAYASFDDFWTPFLGAAGPAGSYLALVDSKRQERLREELRARLDSPNGPFRLAARAWYAAGRV